MPNSSDIKSYPIQLFEAFEAAAAGADVYLRCDNLQAAKNLRSYMYTLRGLLQRSPETWHQELGASVASKKFYIDGLTVVIADPMMQLRQSITITTTGEPT